MIFRRTCYICWQFITTLYRFLFNVLLNSFFWKDRIIHMRFSSLTKSMRSANSGSLFSFILITNTFLDQLSLVPPGSFDRSMHITSGVSRTFQVCICVTVSHFNRKFRNLLYPSASPYLTCGQCFISFR